MRRRAADLMLRTSMGRAMKTCLWIVALAGVLAGCRSPLSSAGLRFDQRLPTDGVEQQFEDLSEPEAGAPRGTGIERAAFSKATDEESAGTIQLAAAQ